MLHHHHQQQQQDLYTIYAQVYGGAAAKNFLPPQYNAADQFLRPFEAPSHDFLINSLSDIALDGFEEQLARVSTSDTYVGPPRPHKKSSQRKAAAEAQKEPPEKQALYVRLGDRELTASAACGCAYYLRSVQRHQYKGHWTVLQTPILEDNTNSSSLLLMAQMVQIIDIQATL